MISTAYLIKHQYFFRISVLNRTHTVATAIIHFCTELHPSSIRSQFSSSENFLLRTWATNSEVQFGPSGLLI